MHYECHKKIVIKLNFVPLNVRPITIPLYASDLMSALGFPRLEIWASPLFNANRRRNGRKKMPTEVTGRPPLLNNNNDAGAKDQNQVTFADQTSPINGNLISNHIDPPTIAKPEQKLASACRGEKPTGWYASRKTYRSVAYGTWKVGAARRLLSSQSEYELPNDSVSDDDKKFRAMTDTLQSSPGSCARSSVPVNNGHAERLGGSTEAVMCPYSKSEMVSEVQNVNGQPRTCFGPDERLSADGGCCSDQESTTDCYSAEDYCRFRNSGDRNGPLDRHSSTTDDDGYDVDCNLPNFSSDIDQSLQTVLERFRELSSCAAVRQKPHKKRVPVLFHKRSASAGNDAIFAVTSSVSQTMISREPTKKPGYPSPSGGYAATRNFLRRFYNNVHLHNHFFHQLPAKKAPGALPVAGHVGDVKPQASLAKLDSSSISSSPSSSIPSPGEYRLPQNGISAGIYDADTSWDSFAPDHSLNFVSWPDAYEHLKKELNKIRACDMSILKDFQKLEQDLRVVKVSDNCSSPSPIVELAPNLESAFST